jgi:hypothetical protein
VATKANKKKSGPKGKASTGKAKAQNPYVYPFPPDQWTEGRIDMGVDFAYKTAGAKILAIGNATILSNASVGGGFGPGGVLYKLTDGPRAGTIIYVYEGLTPTVRSKQSVKAGDIIAHGCCTGSIEIGLGDSSGNALAHTHYTEGQVTQEGQQMKSFLDSIKSNTVSGSPVGGGGAGGGGLSEQDIFSVARAGAVSTQFELPGLLDFATSAILTGDQALMNDKPLWEFIQQLCQSSLRSFQSLPNGAFFAFFPDYFGNYTPRKPYWNIEDIEVLDGKIELTDDELATHVYVVGDINFDQTIDFRDMVMSQGSVNIFDALTAGLIQGTGLPTPSSDQIRELLGKDFDKTRSDQAKTAQGMNFLTRYGARPDYQPEPLLRHGPFEIMSAIMEFQRKWSSQFSTDFTFTFMPELFPGGIIGFPNHHIQCYIESVVHTFDYEAGFTTQATISSPASLQDDPDAASAAVSAGMVKPI